MFPLLKYDTRSQAASGSVLSPMKSRDPFKLLCLLHLFVMFTTGGERFILSFPILRLYFSFTYYLLFNDGRFHYPIKRNAGTNEACMSQYTTRNNANK